MKTPISRSTEPTQDFDQLMNAYAAEFERQVKEAGGWPDIFYFPEPLDDWESEALMMVTMNKQEEAGKLFGIGLLKR